jgi:hypothetical protein
MNEFTLDIERKYGKMNTTLKVYHRGEDETGNDDIIKALKEEMGSVTWVFTKVEFEKRFDDAMMRVLKQIGTATKPFASQIQG